MQQDQLQTEHDNNQQQLVSIQVQQMYNRQIRELQDEILSIYFDLFILYFAIFFLNAYISWDVSLNFPLIFLIVVKLLGTYILCKLENKTSYQNLCNIIDKFIQILFLLHILLAYNELLDQLIITTIIFLVTGLIFITINIKNFFSFQPFYQYFLLVNAISWILRFFISIAVLQYVKLNYYYPNKDFLEIYILLQVLFYFLIIVVSILSINLLFSCMLKYTNKKFSIIFRGKLLLIITIVGIANVFKNLSDLALYYKSRSKDVVINQANYSLVFLIIYYSFNFLFLIIEYQPFSEFFNYCHKSYQELYRISRIQPSEIITPVRQSTIKEVPTQGILRVTLQKISKTFFKLQQVEDNQQKNEFKQIEKKEEEIEHQDQNQNTKKFLKTEVAQKDENEEQQFQQKSNNSSKENMKCIVCFEVDANAMFYPCGHGGMCYECARIVFDKNNICSLCRQQIKSIIKYDNQEENKDKYHIVSVSTKVK